MRRLRSRICVRTSPARSSPPAVSIGDSAEAIVESGDADLVAFGRHFSSNPDLPYRLKHNLPLTPYVRAAFWGGDEKNYSDFPVTPTVKPLSLLQCLAHAVASRLRPSAGSVSGRSKSHVTQHQVRQSRWPRSSRICREPKCRAPGPNEVRIKVKAIGINRAESMWRHDDYIEPVTVSRRAGL